ncbi:MAG: DUF393 domain-containing protein [Deltaproteobacteria bacterium]|nr:DUF393 domain-containing protein [Deltaproteobacteria bacterium]
MTTSQKQPRTILLFDGDCALCNGLVRWLLNRRRGNEIDIIPLQSPAGNSILSLPGRNTLTASPSTVVVKRNGRLFTQSDAVLQIAMALGGLWRMAAVFRLVPRRLRNAMYNWVARHRLKWFGAATHCELPSHIRANDAPLNTPHLRHGRLNITTRD